MCREERQPGPTEDLLPSFLGGSEMIYIRRRVGPHRQPKEWPKGPARSGQALGQGDVAHRGVAAVALRTFWRCCALGSVLP